MTGPLRVELFVCRECGQVGKRPISDVGGQIKGWCKGPYTTPHRKRKMEKAVFVEERRS